MGRQGCDETSAMTALRLLAFGLATYLLMAPLWVLVPLPAHGHAFYSTECCSGKDCAAVRPELVRATAKGWRVEIGPGDHPLARKYRVIFLVPYGDKKVKPSPDGQFHACIAAWADVLFCLYTPEMGA